MLQVVVFNSESDTQFFDTQDGGEKKAQKSARDGKIITLSVFSLEFQESDGMLSF